MRSWTWHRWASVALVSCVAAVLLGVPTGVIPSSFYHRMTPVLWWNYPVWALSSVLTGLVVATYVRRRADGPAAGRATAGGMLSVFAIGCPVCNKLVVALIGLSGALNLWAPIQPLLGLLSLALLSIALRARLRGERACPWPAQTSAEKAAVTGSATPPG